MTVTSYTDSYETTTIIILVNKQSNYFRLLYIHFLEGYYKTNKLYGKFVLLNVLKPETLSVWELFTSISLVGDMYGNVWQKYINMI